MNYCLCKLKFLTPLHTGDSERAKSLDGSSMCFCADTLFSALCCIADSHRGAEGAAELCRLAERGDLLFSDTMPFHHDTLFVPRPVLLPVEKRVVSDVSDIKAFKNLKYIPVEQLPKLVSYFNGVSDFSPKDIFTDFGKSEARERVAIAGLDQPSPYTVGTFSFNEDCGLYFIMSAADVSILDSVLDLVKLLGVSGVGGKVSSGLGKFTLAEDEMFFSSLDDCFCFDNQIILLWEMLENDYIQYMSITSSLPADGELDEAINGAFYTLKRRGGFVQSASFNTAAKKQTQFFLAAGSLFSQKYHGELFNVYNGGAHKVYRYSKPLFLGVK